MLISTLNFLLSRLWCYFLLTLLTTVGGFHFLYAFFLYPLKFIVPDLFRSLISLQLFLTIPGFLCIPFSWAGCKAYSNGFGRLKNSIGKDQMILANHSGRIDWLFGLYTGSYYGQRVGFVTEATIMFLPLIGWQRFLVEDIFVFKSFKRDKERILKNIESFKKSKVRRWVFLCPEGHIADFAAHDEKYIADCQSFCVTQGFEPFEMTLTPRYKGMQCFTKILDSKKTCVSATMTYMQNGSKLVKPLKSKDRIVPDLWTVVNGNLECYIHMHDLTLSTESDQVKQELMLDYARKDRLLHQFYKTGSFPPALPGKSVEESPENWKPLYDDELSFVNETTESQNTPESEQEELITPKGKGMQVMKSQHVSQNLSFFAQFAFFYMVAVMLGIEAWLLPSFATLFMLLTLSHLTGEMLSKGQSRESVPFEGMIRGLLSRHQSVKATS